MEKEFRLKEGQYVSKEKAHVEIIEHVEPRVFVVTEENVLKTIEHLEARRAEYNAKIDAEILQNQEMLEGIRSVNKEATIESR